MIIFHLNNVSDCLQSKSYHLTRSVGEKFVFTLEKEDAKRKVQPGMRTFPDWLMATIEECIILKLFGFDIDLISLEPYAHYSEHLSFMMNPEAFDYTKVNTDVSPQPLSGSHVVP